MFSILPPQYTDELTPHMEWLTEKKVLATRDINSNSAGETEELIEKQEKVIDQLDKKRKVILVNCENFKRNKNLISNSLFVCLLLFLLKILNTNDN